MITVSVYNIEGNEVEKMELDAGVFDGTINKAAVYQVINAFRLNQRCGLAATKTRGEVSGGGKKPWKQKGTGRSRHGSIRSPLWRHGGVVFGPHPRDCSYSVSKKLRNLALKSSLNSKINGNDLIVLEDLKIEKPKTKEMIKILSNLKLDLKSNKKRKNLLLVDKLEKNLKLSLRNIALININAAADTHAYHVLASGKLIITKDGLNALVKRLKK